MTTPDRSLEQRRAALERANAVRTARKALKRELKARGLTALLDLLRNPAATAGRLVPNAPAGYVDTMKVADAMIATRGIGTVKASTTLRRAKVSPSKTLEGLTRRQRGELLELLSPYRGLASTRPSAA